MRIHFVGIGGIGMSGIALICLEKGFAVSGSDLKSSQMTELLIEKGAVVHKGHHADHLPDCDLVVYTSDAAENNPEIVRAHSLHIPCIQRCQMLAEIMRDYKNVCISGSHGKTTTTALVGELLKQARLDPLVINGGIINSIASNINMGSGHWCISEADESDGSFLKLPTNISIITNIDYEHMNYYETHDNLMNAFKQFIEQTSYLGCTIACLDDPHIREIIEQFPNRRIVTYGFEKGAVIQGLNVRTNIHGSTFDVKDLYTDLHLSLIGSHNVLNALAVVGLAQFLKLDEESLRKALSEFKGVQRRFTIRGTINDAVMIDDYAHHPREIKATIHAAKQYGAQKIIAVVEPHRFSRVQLLMDDFAKALNEADEIVLAPLYASTEEPIEGVTSRALGEKLTVPVTYIENEQELYGYCKNMGKSGDVILCMGAGNISNWCKKAISLNTLEKTA